MSIREYELSFYHFQGMNECVETNECVQLSFGIIQTNQIPDV